MIDDWVRLLNGKMAGAGRAMVKCPAHNDKTRSMLVTEKHNRINPTFHCFAGCEFTDVLPELQRLGLWHEKDRKKIIVPESKKREGRKEYISIINMICVPECFCEYHMKKQYNKLKKSYFWHHLTETERFKFETSYYTRLAEHEQVYWDLFFDE